MYTGGWSVISNERGVDNVLATILFCAGVFALMVLSVREKAYQLSLREKSLNGTPSPLAGALAYLVGVAGGIYLALSLLVDFLAVNVPSRVAVLGLELDPLAAIAITLALLQPFILRLYRVGRCKIIPGGK